MSGQGISAIEASAGTGQHAESERRQTLAMADECRITCDWQIPRSTEFNIASVDRQADFWDSALSTLTDALISKILHCKIFTKLSYLGIQHC